MKKIKKFLLGNIKTVVAFILGIIISGVSVYAATILFNSNQVGYDNTSSGMSATNVQDAIDELYRKATQPKGKNNIVYFAYGDPTTSSTTDYTTLNKELFVALNGGQKSVCVIRNSRLHCFDNNNYTIEKDHFKDVFSDWICEEDSDRGIECCQDIMCERFVDLYTNGLVDFSSYTGVGGNDCSLSPTGEVDCW